MNKTSIVLGSSGLIGRSLILDLLEKSNKVIAILRNDKNLPIGVEKLIINFDDFIINGKLPNCDQLFICIGTTIKKVGSKEDFIKVDYTYAYEFAKKALEGKASEVHLVSSVGADSRSNNFYLKTKGQIEDSILGLKFDHTRIYRPSLLLGKRDEIRLFEKLGQLISPLLNNFLFGSMKKYRSINATKVARSMAYNNDQKTLKYFYYNDFINQ
tara:strand:- start:439 stop:1077 length:639 start_codon:yes stop_codon:yes gene_type:complete